MTLNDLADELRKALQGAGNAVGGATQTVSNYFTPNVGVVQQPKQYISPIRQPIQVPQVRNFWTDIPSVNPTQVINSIPSLYNKIGGGAVQATPFAPGLNFARNVIQNSPVASSPAGRFGGDVLNNFIQTPANYVQGTMRATAGAINKNPQQFLGGVGQAGAAALNVLPIGGAGKALSAGEALTGMGIKNAIKTGAVTGAGVGGLYGFLSGLDANKDKSLKDQLVSAGLSGVVNAAVGGVVGAGVGGATSYIGQWLSKKPSDITFDITKLRPGESPQAYPILMAQYVRDKLGRFAPKQYQETPQEAQFVRDLKIQPLTQAEKKALDIKYGWLQGKPGLTTQSLTPEEGQALRKVSGQGENSGKSNIAPTIPGQGAPQIPTPTSTGPSGGSSRSSIPPPLNQGGIKVPEIKPGEMATYYADIRDQLIKAANSGAKTAQVGSKTVPIEDAISRYHSKAISANNVVTAPLNQGATWSKYRDPNSSAMTAVSVFNKKGVQNKLASLQKVNPNLEMRIVDRGNNNYIIEYRKSTQLNQGANTTPAIGKETLPVAKIANLELVVPTTIEPKSPLGSTPPPGVPGGGAQIPPSGPSIDPVQKIINALKGAKPIRNQQEAIYTKIRSQQAGALVGIGGQMKGEAGLYQKLGKLKGEMPKVSFESIKSQFQQPELDFLYNKIEASNLSPFEKVTAQVGLKKLLGAEGGTIPNNSELGLLNQVFPPEFVQAVLDKRPFIQKLFANVQDALNIPRAIMATADMSAPLRQGAFLIGRPKQWLPAFGEQFKYFFSPKAYEGLQANIQARPTYQLMRDSKLAITDMSPLLNQHEETFMSNIIDKIPGIGAITQASQRSYSGFLNKLRADTFDDLVKSAKSQGLDANQVAPDIARFVNSATGRGELPGGLQRAAVVLNGLMFSPRLLASRLNLMNPVYYASLDPFVRKEALKSLFTFAGTAMTTLGLAKLAGADVGADPRSADFGKIKFGNTRYDILAGFQQPIRLAAQLISGKIISTTTGREITLGEGYKPMTRGDIVANFLQSKESPTVGFAMGLLQGANSIGQPFNIGPEIVQRFIPMVIQDMYDLAKDRNSPLAALAGIPGIFGVGVQTYGKQIPNIKISATGNPSVQLSPLPGMAEDIVSKITGAPQSNVPLNQQQVLVNAKNLETQQSIAADKAKQALQTGQTPSGMSQSTQNINGQDVSGFMVGNKFLYVDPSGIIKTKDLTPKTTTPKTAAKKVSVGTVSKIKAPKKIKISLAKAKKASFKIKVPKMASIKIKKAPKTKNKKYTLKIR